MTRLEAIPLTIVTATLTGKQAFQPIPKFVPPCPVGCLGVGPGLFPLTTRHLFKSEVTTYKPLDGDGIHTTRYCCKRLPWCMLDYTR